MHNFGILVLAAGQSSRFGSDKLMAKMPDGQPIIAHSLAPLLILAEENNLALCVITRADNLDLIDYLSSNKINFSICPDTHLGMGHSIAHGVKTNQAWQGWMIALADMPNIGIQLLKSMLENIEEEKNEIVRPQLLTNDRKIPAHPVYFPQKFGYQLSKLSGDNGAKHIIQQQRWLTIVDGNKITENTLIDVDTTEVLKAIHRQQELIQ